MKKFKYIKMNQKCNYIISLIIYNVWLDMLYKILPTYHIIILGLKKIIICQKKFNFFFNQT